MLTMGHVAVLTPYGGTAMAYTVKQVDVWAADIQNKPGMLARVLEALTIAGAQLEFMIARKATDRTSRVFVAPLTTAKQKKAATDVGLVKAAGLHAVRIEGPDRAGLGAEITRAVAAKGINLRGASAAAVGKKALFYLAVSSAADQKAAIAAVKRALGRSGR